MFTLFFFKNRRDAAATPPRLRRLSPRQSRRRGVAFVYTALGLAVALMVAAVVIDIGLLYQRKAAMQRAADSSALAGAYSLANFNSPYNAYIAAGKMAEPIYSERQVASTTPAPAWNPSNGTSIQAEGHLPINFNISGTTKMALGKVPPQAGGGELIIRKFDTDINSKSITYTCDKIPNRSWPGTLSTDGTFATDTIRIPDSYRDLAEGGTWFAEYVAGNQDTSVWDMSYTGNGPGRPGQIKLVR